MLRSRCSTAAARGQRRACGVVASARPDWIARLDSRIPASTASRSPLQQPSSHDGAQPAAVALPQARASALTAGTRQAPTHSPTVQHADPLRLRVAVDVDEVLGVFVATLNAFCLEHYDMKYHVKDYWVYEFAKIWGCSQEQSNHIVHEFFKSQHFNDGIPVIPGAHEALTRLSASCDLVVVTSRQHIIQDVTLEWIDRHYPGLFKEVYFGNHFALAGNSRKKSDICKSIGASVLVDDNPTYAIECAEAGINVLLYDWHDSYPWSKIPSGKMHPLITVVRNWQEVEHATAAIAARRQ